MHKISFFVKKNLSAQSCHNVQPILSYFHLKHIDCDAFESSKLPQNVGTNRLIFKIVL